MSEQKKHYHFIGIGGVGMGTIASLLLAKGESVSGSDIKESEYTLKLKEQGATIVIGHDAGNVENPDCVVYSSAISKDNPELIAAREKNISVLQRAQMLAKLMEPHKAITVAGAHGKTTTTSMVSHLLIEAGLHPTTAVGGMLNGSSYHASLGKGQYFVAEVDESDGSFLYFSPYFSVITNIDFEHVDYFKDWNGILAGYKKFISNTRLEGCLFACGEDKRLKELLKESHRRFITYGFGKDNDVYAENVILDGFSSRYDCVYKGEDFGQIQLRVPGRHNVLNSLACVALGKELSVAPHVIKHSLETFTGAKRRFQLKGEVEGIMVVDDYGHHPTEIAATLQATRSFKRHRIVVAFQPHRYTRTKFLMEEFAKCLGLCDYLIITDIYAASEEPIAGIDAKELCVRTQAFHNIPVVYLKKEEIVPHLLRTAERGDLILTLGAGDITRFSDELVLKLKEQKAASRLAYKGK